MKTRSYYSIIAKNRFGHSTVYVANNSIIDLIRVCVRAVWYYQWINLQVTLITETIERPMAPWMQILLREKTPVVKNVSEEKYRTYVAINQYEADKFASFIGAQSVVNRSDGAFEILVLTTGAYS